MASIKTVVVEVRYVGIIVETIVRTPLYCENRSIGIPFHKAWWKGKHYRINGNYEHGIRRGQPPTNTYWIDV